MGTLDAAIMVQKETTYATAAAGITKAFEGKADAMKREVSFLDSVGIRAGMKTERSDRRKVVNMGASGKLEVDFLNKGMLHLLQGCLVAGTPAQQGGTPAYSTAFTATKDEPLVSFSFQILRPIVEGAVQAFTYLGSTITGWTMKQEVGGLVSLSCDFDAADERTDVAAGTPAYPATASPFDWTQCALTLNSVAFEPESVELTADLGLATDRRRLRANALKKQPRRKALPSYGGTFKAEWVDLTAYNAFVAGTIYPAQITWTGANISGIYNHKVTVDLPAIQFNGETPVVDIEKLGAISLPFKVLDDGTNPPVTITVITTDTTV